MFSSADAKCGTLAGGFAYAMGSQSRDERALGSEREIE
jgi:hypothetical protein